MGLLTILKKIKQAEKEMRLLVLGLDNAGKTTIIKKFMGEAIDTISPTLGFNIVSLEFKKCARRAARGALACAPPTRATPAPPPPRSPTALPRARARRSYQLNVWDVGGQKTIRSYWRNYFEQTDGLVWVVDSADRRRLRDCREELAALLSQEKLAGASLLIFANKQDLAGALRSEEIAETLGLHGEAFSRRHWAILPCSAFTGDGLVEGMEWVVTDIASRVFMGSDD